MNNILNSDDNSSSDGYKMINFNQINNISNRFVSTNSTNSNIDFENYSSKQTCSSFKKSRQSKTVSSMFYSLNLIF